MRHHVASCRLHSYAECWLVGDDHWLTSNLLVEWHREWSASLDDGLYCGSVTLRAWINGYSSAEVQDAYLHIPSLRVAVGHLLAGYHFRLLRGPGGWSQIPWELSFCVVSIFVCFHFAHCSLVCAWIPANQLHSVCNINIERSWFVPNVPRNYFRIGKEGDFVDLHVDLFKNFVHRLNSQYSATQL